MKISNLINESSISNAYTIIINKLKSDISNVSKALKYDDDDLYDNPEAAKEFWVNFYDEMALLKNVISNYSKILREIDSGDSVYNEQELGQLENKFKELTVILGKKLNYADSVKKLTF